MEKSGVHPTSGLRPRRKSQLKGFVRERSTAASCRGPLQKIEAPAPRLGQPNNDVLRRGRCRSLWVNFVESMRRRFPYPRNDPLTTAAPILLVIGGDCTQYPPRDDWVRCWPRDRPRNTAGEIPSIHSQLTCGRLQRFSFVDDRTDDTCSWNRALRKPMNLSGLLQPLYEPLYLYLIVVYLSAGYFCECRPHPSLVALGSRAYRLALSDSQRAHRWRNGGAVFLSSHERT
jgi:hypothetical protein